MALGSKQNRRRRRIAILALAVLALTTVSLSAKLAMADDGVIITGKTMGPIDYQIVVHDTVSDVDKLKREIQALLDDINSKMSTYVQDSDVSRFNRADANTWVSVDQKTLDVVSAAIKFSELSSGAFDITVGPAVNAWDFGPDADADIPGDSEILRLQKIVGYKKLKIRQDPPSVSKTVGGTAIDLSAIAKGYAVDQVAELLTSNRIENFLVEIGGEVAVAGETPNGKWRIGIEKPLEMTRAVAEVVELSDRAMATSGDYRNFRMVDGIRYSHTIDPTTCRPVTNPPASVSIIADDCMTADALATAIMVTHLDKGSEICRKLGAELHAFVRNGTTTDKTELSAQRSDGFPIVAVSNFGSPKSRTGSIVPVFLGTLFVFLTAVVAMAVGAIINKQPIRGSCGGIAAETNPDGSTACSLCSKPVTECPKKQTVEQGS